MAIMPDINVSDSIAISEQTDTGNFVRRVGAQFRKNNARFHRLENLMERVKTLELALKEKNQ